MEFKSLELVQTLKVLFPIWAKLVRPRNVHWLSQEMFERLKVSDPAIWRWNLDSDRNVISFKPTLFEDQLFVWKSITQVNFPLSKKSFPRPAIINDETLTVHHVLAPVRGPQSKEIIGYVLFENLDEPTSKTLERLSKLIQRDCRHLEFCYFYGQAKTQSFIDDLTSLYNQRYLPLVLDREINRMTRMQKKFSVLFIDIDYFKRVNDTRGHWIGSKLLVEVSEILRASTRSCDYAFRYGGDEFIILLVDSGPENGQIVAERIRQAIEKHTFSVDNVQLNLTVSIGLASFPDHAKTSKDLIQLADQAMYYGKNKSRNTVFIAG